MVRSFNVTLLDLRLFALLVCDFGLVVRSQDAAARSSQQPEAAIISLPALGMEDSQDFLWGALHAQKWLATPQVWKMGQLTPRDAGLSSSKKGGCNDWFTTWV